MNLNKIRPFFYNVYAKCIGIFFAVCVSDFVWARYMASVARDSRLEASYWAVGVIGLGAFITISYVNDKRLVIPAMMGAFVGTYLAI